VTTRIITLAHIFQVGAGSGGMPVLDMLARDAGVSRVTLVEPDVYKSHNVVRHLFPESAVGRLKGELAAEWLRERRPDLEINILNCDLLNPARQDDIEDAVSACDVGVCAADNEPAKYHFDLLMRQAGKPWTLGEVLSGGIGGFVHRFVPGGPCYGCVASHLQRAVVVDSGKAPDYSQPGGPVEEATVPASKAAITTVAGLHAVLTLELLADPAGYDPGFTTMLLTLKRVPGVFEEPFRPFRFRIPRAAECLICRAEESPTASASEDLDVALDQALARLGDA
jgi:molybdopterin/thiamine biosynthesis adenylyltransferase